MKWHAISFRVQVHVRVLVTVRVLLVLVLVSVARPREWHSQPHLRPALHEARAARAGFRSMARPPGRRAAVVRIPRKPAQPRRSRRPLAGGSGGFGMHAHCAAPVRAPFGPMESRPDTPDMPLRVR